MFEQRCGAPGNQGENMAFRFHPFGDLESVSSCLERSGVGIRMAGLKQGRLHPGRDDQFRASSGGRDADDGTGQGDSFVRKRACEHFPGGFPYRDDMIRIATDLLKMTADAFTCIHRSYEKSRQMPQDVEPVPFICHAVDDNRCSESCARPCFMVSSKVKTRSTEWNERWLNKKRNGTTEPAF